MTPPDEAALFAAIDAALAEPDPAPELESWPPPNNCTRQTVRPGAKEQGR